MEKFCGNCGAVIYDGYKVCGNCGTPVEAQAVVPVPAPVSVPVQSNPGFELKNSGGKKNLIVIGGIAAVAIIVIIAIIAGVAGSGYKKPIKNMAKAIEEADFDMICESYCEDYYDEILGGETEDYFELGMEVIFDYIEEECGEDYEVKVEFNDKEKYNKDDIEEFVEDTEEDYGIEFDADDIKKLYKLDVTLTAEGDDGDAEILDGDIYVAKIDGEWGIIWDDSEMTIQEDASEYAAENMDKYYDYY